MATNVYFNNFPKNTTSEQLLVEDLVIESLKMYGMDVWYLPRSSRDQVDYLFGDDSLKQYVSAYPIEMYLENVISMGGEGDFISKFGLEIREEITLLVARRRFASTISQIRPNEGDLIFSSLFGTFYEVMFVEHENNQAMYHTLGKGNSYLYAIKLKQYVFSSEFINTGIAEIDNTVRNLYPRTKLTLTGVSGNFVNDEIVYQGVDVDSATARAYVYDYIPNTELQIYFVNGTFTTGNITGSTSGATATTTVVSDTILMDDAFEDIIDNNRIQEEAFDIIDWSESNPFGSP